MNSLSQPFDPVFDSKSEILILGSFPSVKSRKTNFFYGNPQNRFWKLIAELTNSELPSGIEEKKHMLLKNKIALWDVLASCTIKGSSDMTITKEKPADLNVIFSKASIKIVLLNGSTAYKFYKKYNSEFFDIQFLLLPSTSPANASYSYDRLKIEWAKALKMHL